MKYKITVPKELLRYRLSDQRGICCALGELYAQLGIVTRENLKLNSTSISCLYNINPHINWLQLMRSNDALMSNEKRIENFIIFLKAYPETFEIVC